MRADEGDAFFLEASDEGGVLGQETVAGVDGIAFEFLGCLHHGFDIKVGIERIAPVVGVGDVSHLDGKRQAVLSTVDDGRLDAHVPEGAKDTKSDFAAVGNQHALEAHGRLVDRLNL